MDFILECVQYFVNLGPAVDSVKKLWAFFEEVP